MDFLLLGKLKSVSNKYILFHTLRKFSHTLSLHLFKVKVPTLLRLVSFSGVSVLTLTCCSKSPDSSGPNGEMVSLLMSCEKKDAIEIKKWSRHAQIFNPNVADIHNIHLSSQISFSRNSTRLFLKAIHKLQWVDWWVYQIFLRPPFFLVEWIITTSYDDNIRP